jgi:hypothetical protein
MLMDQMSTAQQLLISLWVSNRPFRDGHHIGRTRFGIPLPSDDLSCRMLRLG